MQCTYFFVRKVPVIANYNIGETTLLKYSQTESLGSSLTYGPLKGKLDNMRFASNRGVATN